MIQFGSDPLAEEEAENVEIHGIDTQGETEIGVHMRCR